MPDWRCKALLLLVKGGDVLEASDAKGSMTTLIDGSDVSAVDEPWFQATDPEGTCHGNVPFAVVTVDATVSCFIVRPVVAGEWKGRGQRRYTRTDLLDGDGQPLRGSQQDLLEGRLDAEPVSPEVGAVLLD